MDYNQAQTAFLNQFPGIAFDDLSAEQRLHVANLADEPDDVGLPSAPQMTQAQKDFLAGDRIEDLSSDALAVFNRLGPPVETPAGEPKVDPLDRSGPLSLDIKAIADFDASRRLGLAHDLDSLNAFRAEAARGIDERFRSVREYEFKAALERVRPYLA